MIIGNGLLANEFLKTQNLYDDVIIFASGVSNSGETSSYAFQRETDLLKKTMTDNPEKLVVAFSSCALIDKRMMTPYYMHKRSIESLLKKDAKKYMIIRLPQIIGSSKNQTTLINFLFDCVKHEKEFYLRDQAFRYVIDKRDVSKIVNYLIQDSHFYNQVIELANTYRYSIYEIVRIIETLLDKNAVYQVINKEDKYHLGLEVVNDLCKKDFLELGFGKDYLKKKIREEYMDIN